MHTLGGFGPWKISKRMKEDVWILEKEYVGPTTLKTMK